MKEKIKIFFWMIADFIIIVSGVYVSYLVRYLGVIPAYNFFPFTKLYYLFAFFGIIFLYYMGLYKSDKTLANKEIILRSFKAIFLSTIIMMDITYIWRGTLMSFPGSVFILSIPVNTILCGFWRVFILYDEEKAG